MRHPAVSGMFYTSSQKTLEREVQQYLAYGKKTAKKKTRNAIICPHAGYMYSGRTAGVSFASCSNWQDKEITAVIIGPNHTGLGAPLSVSFDDWKTPLGIAECDTSLAEAIVHGSKFAKKDELAHMREHSDEVQLPFLQVACPHAKFVAICMGIQNADFADDLGKAIHKAVNKTGRKAIVVASSDFTHYEPAEIARKKDMAAISLLLKMDWRGFEALVENENLSICGHGAIAAALNFAILSGAGKCELLEYTNSGAVTGDDASVVAYAGIGVGKE